VELTGRQMVGNNGCVSSSAAMVYLTGNNEVVHDVNGEWRNWPWPPPPAPWGGSYGVILAPGVQYDLVDGVTAANLPAASQRVLQQGTGDTSTIVANNPGSSLVVPGPGYTVTSPQGRLTLVSKTPVMTGNATARSEIYYDCYSGAQVPYASGADQLDVIAASGQNCEMDVGLTTAVEQANDIFDVWWWHNAGAPVICVATNGTGAGWRGDVGGSLNARATAISGGYTALDTTTRGYITNANAFGTANSAHCYGPGSLVPIDYVAAAPLGMIPANALTYLGSFYTTAAGQTAFTPAPSGSAAQALVGICNAYNRVSVIPMTQDSHAAYTVNAPIIWEVADAKNSGVNNILVLDCLQSNSWNAQLTQPVNNSGTGLGATPELSISLQPLSALSAYVAGSVCQPGPSFPPPAAHTSQQSTSAISVTYTLSNLPLLGATCAQGIETALNALSANFNPSLQLQLNWQY
jgi:hypothetical protein